MALYGRTQVVAPRAFADRAVGALAEEPLREVVSREVTVQLVERGSADLVSARPVVESVVDFVVASEPFRRTFRTAALNAHRLLFEREGGNAAFDVADVGTVVASSVRSVSPKIARQIPRDVPARLIELRERDFATSTLRVADSVRTLGLVLPIAAALVLGGGIALARDRRRAVTRAGIALGVAAGALAIVLVVVRTYVVRHVFGEDELTNDQVRGAVGTLWDAYLGDLLLWALGAGALALVVAAASASLLQPFTAADGLDRMRRRLQPSSRRGRALRGAVAMALGVFIVLEPSLAVSLAAVVVGAFLLYFGAGELLSVVHRPEAITPQARRRRVWATAAGTAAALGVLGGGLALALSGGGEPGSPRAAGARACNGYPALCSRRLDQVVFAGTHNAMSNADTPGWLLVNQRHAILRQLRDGIRLFLIDPHYGSEQPNGLVRTDLDAERRGLNRVSKQLSPEAIAALQRVNTRLGKGGTASGKREIWLCHSVCELGATRMGEVLGTIRGFLERNPGEVVILFDEDYVREDDLDAAYRDAGLAPYLATLDRTRPLPTLGELVSTGKRVIVFTEREPDGQYAWNHDGFSWIQDTPLGATAPGQLRCARERGDADSPLFMVNHWIDRFPPPATANRAVLSERFITDRAERCRRERRMRPNLIATDFYDEGNLVDAVRRLNRLEDQDPVPTR